MKMTEIREEQQKLLKILKAFDAFCRENGIKYFLYAGSMLGAVRERGFIKWDGDVDVCMSFSEYQKLDKLAREKGGINGYTWMVYDIDRHIPTFFAKIFEPSVSAENLENFSYIEICPYTGAPKAQWLRNLIRITSLFNYDIYWVKNRIYKNNLLRKHNQIGMLLKILFFWFPSKLCIKYFKYCCSCWHNSPYGMYMGIYSVKRTLIPMSWLEEEPVYVDFEDMKVPILKNYHELLTLLYGDYMTPVRYSRYKN